MIFGDIKESGAGYEKSRAYVEKYLSPYLKIEKMEDAENDKGAVLVTLRDGTVFTLSYQ